MKYEVIIALFIICVTINSCKDPITYGGGWTVYDTFYTLQSYSCCGVENPIENKLWLNEIVNEILEQRPQFIRQPLRTISIKHYKDIESDTDYIMISNWKQRIGYVDNLDILYNCDDEVVMT